MPLSRGYPLAHYAQHDSRPRAPPRRVDRDPRASPGQPRSLRSCTGASPGEQNTIAPSHHRAECRTGAGQLSEVRLRLLARIDAHERAQDPLLQVYWLRWLAKTGRSYLQQPPLRPTGYPRSDRLGRVDPTAGRLDSETAGT